MSERLNLTVSGVLQEKIEQAATRRGLSKAELVRRAVEAALIADERTQENPRTHFGLWTENEEGEIVRVVEIQGM